ncbi:MAG: hypothetical protein ACOYOU_03330 [Kiritimatiellia bacterium]
MKKIISFAVALAAIGTAYAGLDMYTSKNYTTLLAPSSIGITMSGATTNASITTNGTVASSATTGVDCIGIQGRGALVISLNPNGGGVLSVSFATCATTNGSYVTVTNAAGASSWGATNTAAYIVAPIKPNAQSRFWRTTATATAVTNGSVGSVLVSE